MSMHGPYLIHDAAGDHFEKVPELDDVAFTQVCASFGTWSTSDEDVRRTLAALTAAASEAAAEGATDRRSATTPG